MSNALVGQIYHQVMQAVIAASTNDFEEWGVDQQTLQSLQQIWQQKLSAQHTAAFPWDPPPVQPPAPPSQANLPSNSSLPGGLMSPTDAPGAAGDVRIKTEPGMESGIGYPSQNGYSTHVPNSQIAQQRAAQLLQQQYGTAAHASIDAMQQRGLHLPGRINGTAGGSAQPAHPNDPQIKQEYKPNSVAPSGQPSLAAAQTDGSGDAESDWRAFMTARRAQYDGDREHALGLLRANVKQQAAVVDSGLMMPISELPKRRRNGAIAKHPSPSDRTNPAHLSQSPVDRGIPQLDGADVKDEDGDLDDEDAINSDLDDSEDELNNDDEEEQEQGETMLCTYDKVQRVKNKWKCVLKDGVLSTGNKEYLFHKATGEFEW